MKQIEYSEARGRMLPGDVLAFSGRGRTSSIIKWRTNSAVSHVGTVIQTCVRGDDRTFNQIAESTSLNGFSGVIMSRISDRLRDYRGSVWWLPLSWAVREHFDTKRFFNWIIAQEGKPYDTRQAVWSAIDWIPFVKSRECFDKLFCSELLAGGFEHANVIRPLNASEQTPKDVVSWNLYEDAYQLKGKMKDIKKFNTVLVRV